MTTKVRLTVNAIEQAVDADAHTSLLDLLRHDLGLTGAHYGCGHGECGACYVLVDRKAVPACVTAVADVAGKDVVTIEGLASGDVLHPVHRPFSTRTPCNAARAPAGW
jgi:nicotinate dehydrogenase subunit A